MNLQRLPFWLLVLLKQLVLLNVLIPRNRSRGDNVSKLLLLLKIIGGLKPRTMCMRMLLLLMVPWVDKGLTLPVPLQCVLKEPFMVD